MSKELLHYLLRSLDFRKVITGTAQPQITRTTLTSIEVTVPPPAEQIKIVEILEEQLSRLDAALASVRAVGEKAVRFRRSLLHAAFTGALTSQDSSNGTLPTGWKKCELQDVAKWGSGGTPKSGNRNFYGGDIPWAVIGDLTESLVTETAQCITKQGLENSSAKVIKPGTVLLAMYGASIGRSGVAAVEMATNQAIAFAVPFEAVTTSGYLLKFLQSQKEVFVRAGQGGAQPNISQTVIKPWPIPIPSIEEQLKVRELVLKENILKKELKSQRLLFEERRSALISAAVTGKIDVRDWLPPTEQ